MRHLCDRLQSYLSLVIGGSRGGVPGARPPYGTQFFRFCIHFHRKVPTSEVHAPLTGARPPTGNPGSATASVSKKKDGYTTRQDHKHTLINKAKNTFSSSILYLDSN